MTSVEWGDLSRQAVSTIFADGGIAAVPIGSLEQHGDHLPTDTDAYLATAVLKEAAKRAQTTVVVLPVLHYGISAYHSRFGGTVWLSDSTFAAVLGDLCVSVRESGASTLVLVNGHGGNIGAVQTAGVKFSEGEFSVFPVTYWELVREAAEELFAADSGSIGHAGQAETSLTLALRPEVVGDKDGPHEPVRPLIGTTTSELFGTSGVIGDPKSAEIELGRSFLEAACIELASLFDSLAVRSVKRMSAP